MTAHTNTGAHDPSHHHAEGRAAQQLQMMGIADPLWITTLLAALQAGGVIIIERTGDMILMPDLDSMRRLDT